MKIDKHEKRQALFVGLPLLIVFMYMMSVITTKEKYRRVESKYIESSKNEITLIENK